MELGQNDEEGDRREQHENKCSARKHYRFENLKTYSEILQEIVHDSPNLPLKERRINPLNNADIQSLRKWQSVNCNWLKLGFCGDFFAGCNLNTPSGYRTS